jgi:hypothetical protein
MVCWLPGRLRPAGHHRGHLDDTTTNIPGMGCRVISTVVTGIGGGAIAIQDFRLQEWVDSVTGLVALGGLIFGCGLPGWAIVRWVFNFIEKNRDAGIDEVAKEVREVL